MARFPFLKPNLQCSTASIRRIEIRQPGMVPSRKISVYYSDNGAKYFFREGCSCT